MLLFVMDGKVGSVFGTGRCEIYVKCIHKFCEKKRILIYVFVYGENSIFADFRK